MKKNSNPANLSTIVVTPGKENDWQILQKLNKEVYLDNAKYDEDIDLDRPMSSQGSENYQATLADPQNICIFALDGLDNAIGYLVARPTIISYRKSRYLEISHMGVLPHWRSKGVGSLLIAECEKEAKKRGFQKMIVSSYWGNELGRNFYRQNGFGEIAVEFEKSLE